MNSIISKRIFKSNNLLVLVLLIFFLIPHALVFSQSYEEIKTPDPSIHNEIKDDDYIPVDRKSQGRSPAYGYTMNNITTVQVNVDSAGQNIVGDAANEPSIAVNPNNRDLMAIGWRQFNTINSNFRQAGYGYTTNRGQTWIFPGVIQPGVFRSDPVLDADANGNFYFNSLTTDPEFMCHVFKSNNGGFAWDNGTFAQGGDKPWMIINKIQGPGIGNIFSCWSSSVGVCSPNNFTRSTDNGESFENCMSLPEDLHFSTFAIGKEGELYLGGSVGLNYIVAKSSAAQDSSQIVTWDMVTVVNLDGHFSIGGPNPLGLLGQTIIAVDTSDSPYHGNIYLLSSVERDSNSDPLDVMFARSTDAGATWSSPFKINDDLDTTAYQWFGTMSVSPTGRIDVIWLDTRDNPGSYNSALYYSNSKDGGLIWTPNQKLSDSFDPHVGWPQQHKMGDYFDMVSDSSGASLAWAATFNNEQDIYYSYITDVTSNIDLEPRITPSPFSLAQNYPNPFNPATIIQYSIPQRSVVTLMVYDVLGNEIATLVNDEKNAGIYSTNFIASQLPSGIYFYKLQAGSYLETKKMLLLK